MKRKTILIIIAAVCAVGMAVSAVRMIQLYVGKVQTDNSYSRLREHINEPVDSETQTPDESDSGADTPDTAASQPDTSAPEEPTIDPKYAQIHAMNSDFVGWIRIDGTNIDYPVMQTVDDPEYYLTRNFDKENDWHGVPFLDFRCDLTSADNYIVYGHRMYDGSMFEDLVKFADASFCEEKHTIEFDTLYESGKWEPVVVFSISAGDMNMFPYNTVTEFSYRDQTASDYVSRCKPYAIWCDENADLSKNKLLTLSTCEYSHTNGRLVIVAAKVN